MTTEHKPHKHPTGGSAYGPPGWTRGSERSPQSVSKKPELFTFQIQGKGIRAKYRVPGWVAAALLRFAMQHGAKS